MSKKIIPDEVQVLFTGPVQIGGYTVRPWTLKKFDQVYPVARPLVAALVAAGMTWDNLEQFLGEKLLDLAPELMPLVRSLIAVTLEIPLAEVEELAWAPGLALAVTIFSQNLEPLKNFSALIPRRAPGTGASTPSP